ncbi:MAG TPA: PRC-barrel domain-containing protein [Ktedonobacteraceae bacterium]|jgi:sporulation protein YlmC with PRC-barrel domain|nr:PRC-barrel domain-containing protein [Ktedonobacteraceae bacterium]
MNTTKQKSTSHVYIGDLLKCKIVTAEGKRLGHLADLQLSAGPEYRVIALFFGRRGWLYRLHVLNPFTSKESHDQTPNSVPWSAIDRIERHAIYLKPGYPKKAED